MKPNMLSFIMKRKSLLRFLAMASKVLLLLLGAGIVACVFGKVVRTEADPVRLDVYYESLCPDSIAFVKNQLAVVYPQLKEILVVDIFPYGNAKNVDNGQGGYLFVCQHGPDECAGNMMLACAKNYISDGDLYVEFNICVMSARDPPTAGELCAEELNIAYESIAECSTSTEGEQLLHEVGVLTHALVPEVTYIPWMVVNDEHTYAIQNGAEYDLLEFVCTEYQGVSKPEACSV
uniref:Gamma-interferon-inducible lysosomal thiol reductase-like n=1 Tax=Hirondellea gigas TaxID=1518452 RepID=A0A2P2I703_9CRUS